MPSCKSIGVRHYLAFLEDSGRQSIYYFIRQVGLVILRLCCFTRQTPASRFSVVNGGTRPHCSRQLHENLPPSGGSKDKGFSDWLTVVIWQRSSHKSVQWRRFFFSPAASQVDGDNLRFQRRWTVMHLKMKAATFCPTPFTGRLSADREIKVLDAGAVRIIKSLTRTGHRRWQRARRHRKYETARTTDGRID